MTDVITGWRVDSPRTDDHPALAALFADCSADTVRSRFFGRLDEFPRDYLDAVLAGRPERHDAVVAWRSDHRGRRQFAGLAGLAAPAPGDSRGAELAVLVADAWQRQGLGSAMVDALLLRARERGVPRVSACVLPGRSWLLAALARRLELESASRSRDCLTGVYRLA